jgi:GWxTD domain-containing protein
MKRIRRLLYPKAPHGAWTPLLAAVVLIASGALALTAWPAPLPQQRSAAQIEADLKASGKLPKVPSLGPEVAYIISDEERAAFQQLDTEEQERDFIEQFWERRDPTPGTAKNEFKEEHYRRVEYSVARFTTQSGKPGWQTDRGRIFIVYGPPDEIESHPSGSPSRPYPFETWRYEHVDGIGDNLFITFTDRNETGDYEITPDPRGQ